VKKLISKVRFGITPQKKKDAEMERLHLERAKRCMGISLICVANTNKVTGELKKGQSRTLCALCGAKTEYYCTGCSRFLCLNKDRMEDLLEQGKISDEVARKAVCKIPIFNKKENKMECRWAMRSCYHLEHEAMWEEYWADINSTINADTAAQQHVDVLENLRGISRRSEEDS
jgi:hypothetical protein